jgi:very-short-patch-repair endonuclease
MNITYDINSLGGLAATHELLSRGWTGRALTRLVRTGDAIRVRQGWYALPTADPTMLSSWRVGGRMTCVSGARALKLAAPSDPLLHVSIPAHHARLRKPDDHRNRLESDPRVVVHWRSATSGSRYIVSPADCLIDLANCQPPEAVLAFADSALRSGLISSSAIARLAQMLASDARELLLHADRRSESFAESVLRARLILAKIPFGIQVGIDGKRVDFLIGQRLVIEVDGREFHSHAESFERDRVRDAELGVLGYRVQRYSYAMVMHRWPLVEAAVRAALARGDHL